MFEFIIFLRSEFIAFLRSLRFPFVAGCGPP